MGVKPRLIRVLFGENDVGGIGGSTRALESLVRHLDRDRFQPIVTFSKRSLNPLIPSLEALGCEILELGPRQPTAPRLSGVVGRVAHVAVRAAIDVLRCALLFAALRRLGLLFRPGDSEDLAAKIVRVLSEPGLAETLSENGWQRVCARFDARRTSAEVMDAWTELLELRAGPEAEGATA